ncbi:hypothetical protein CAPTEDRAFT_187908 [Capitella teleta]|uniref:Uncharacterized protein n=1 Tax=Capitella teleta TaxID=283909 RepID=R7U413_CAPTE|nr:hypothetical protein CAPTEDRAFT_187908 [Capitella teleta]|eukprot:ELU01085.1 hypothetical protein CAPTEDRAFT_187908 [Capitella teleta]
MQSAINILIPPIPPCTPSRTNEPPTDDEDSDYEDIYVDEVDSQVEEVPDSSMSKGKRPGKKLNKSSFPMATAKFQKRTLHLLVEIRSLLQRAVSQPGELVERGQQNSLYYAAKQFTHIHEFPDLNTEDKQLWEWSACVKWHLPSESELSSAEVLTQLSLACVNDSSTAFHSALRTMHCLGLLEPKIKILASTFLQRVIEPIVKVPSTKIDVKSGLRNTLLVTYDGRQKATGAVNPEDLFPSFISAIEFLNEHLLSLELSDGPLMPLLSAEIGQQCIDLIVNECLKRSVPTSNADLDAYCPVVELIHSFHASLVQLGFISEDEVSLTTFADSVSTISASKRMQEVLEKARSLMTTRVHNTVKVTNEQPLGASKPLAGLDGSSAKKTKTTEDIALHTGMKLSANTCQLPECLISQNMAELSRLCYETLYEAKSSNTAQAALQLFFAVRFVVDLYCNVFATQRDSELPQRSAVQHNDCMYLAHHALLLGPQFRHLLPLPSHQSNTTLTLLDFVPKLRRLGAQCFLDQMSRQKALLMESLAGTQGFLSVGEESHGQSSRQALLQAMHQLQHLSNVWHGVLPANIFCKSIGALFNAMLAEVLAAIVSLDDISKDDDICQKILNKT